MLNKYRKRQKLRERKVLLFTGGFHPNVGKTFAFFASSVLKVLPMLKAFVGKTFTVCFICIESAGIAESICRENFRGSSKIHENHEAFILRSFFCLQYITVED